MAASTTREFIIESAGDFCDVERYVCSELKATPQSCSLLRSGSFVSLRLAALYREPSERTHDMVATSVCGTIVARLVQRSGVIQILTRRMPSVVTVDPRDIKKNKRGWVEDPEMEKGDPYMEAAVEVVRSKAKSWGKGARGAAA